MMISDKVLFFPDECRPLRGGHFAVGTPLWLFVVLCHKAERFSAGSPFDSAQVDYKCQVQKYHQLILTSSLNFWRLALKRIVVIVMFCR